MPGGGTGLLVLPFCTPVPAQTEELIPHQEGAMSETLRTASGAYLCAAEWGARPRVGTVALRAQLSQPASPLLESWPE